MIYLKNKGSFSGVLKTIMGVKVGWGGGYLTIVFLRQNMSDSFFASIPKYAKLEIYFTNRGQNSDIEAQSHIFGCAIYPRGLKNRLSVAKNGLPRA